MIRYRGLSALHFGPTPPGDAQIEHDGTHFTLRTPAGKAVGLNLSAAPAQYGSAESLIEIGGSTPIQVAIDDYWFPIRMDLENTNDPATQKMFAFLRCNYTQSNEAQSHLDVAAAQLTLTLTQDTGWAKAVDCGIVVNTAMACQGGASIMASLNAGLVKNAVPTANVVTCGYFGVYGTEAEVAGRGASNIYLNVSTGASIPAGVIFDVVGTMADMFKIPFAGAITHVFNFTETDGSTGAKVGATITGATADADGCLKIMVGGTIYYIPFFVASDVSGSW